MTDVLAEFGNDCKIVKYDGKVYKIDYGYSEPDTYAPSRPAQHTRPSEFKFARGVVESIYIGGFQKALCTPGGAGVDRDKALFKKEFGIDYNLDELRSIDLFAWYRYPKRGIQFMVRKKENTIVDVTLFAPE